MDALCTDENRISHKPYRINSVREKPLGKIGIYKTQVKERVDKHTESSHVKSGEQQKTPVTGLCTLVGMSVMNDD
jgi:hypothetical protein